MKILLILLCSVIFIACSSNVDGKAEPDNLIPRDSIVLILKDLIVIEAHIQTKYVHVSQYHKLMTKSGLEVLKKYHVSHDRFESSIDYYGSRQEMMQSIYAEILDSLNRQASMIGRDVKMTDTIKQKFGPDNAVIHPPVFKN